jgi:rubrerythrin
MRQIKTLILFVGIAAASALACGSASAQQHPSSPEAREALREAMHNEAFASAKYKLFAEHARKAGKNELADQMMVTSNIEFGHFLRWAGLYGLVGSDLQNLQSAIQDETNDDIKLYTRLAAEATARGETTLADYFNEIKAQEEKHRSELVKAVDKAQ